MKRLIPVTLLICLLLAACGPAEPVATDASDTAAPITTVEAVSTDLIDAAASETADAETETPETTEIPLTPEEQERKDFYDLFWELDPETTDAWLEAHPEYFENRYKGISVNQAWLGDDGLDLYTTLGDQVLAIDAENQILIIRIWPVGSRGVMAIAKDPSRLHLYESKDMGKCGEHIGSIADRHNGLLAVTGSGFVDAEGSGNGGEIAGYCKCGNHVYGEHMPNYCFRFQLHENDTSSICRATDPVPKTVTDAMEFEPALLIDGVLQGPGIWNGENPRACIGMTRRGEVQMLVVEGRFSDSPGCSVEECGKIMQEYDGLNALNCDGGTTAILWYRGQPITRCSNRGTPEGRYLPNAWVYVKAGE